MSGKSSGTQSARCAFREQASEFIATVQNRNGSSSRRRTEELFRMNSLPSSSGDSRQQKNLWGVGKSGLARGQQKQVYLFSGLLQYGECGGSVTLVGGRPKTSRSEYGCSLCAQRGDAVCGNGLRIQRKHVEDRFLTGLQDQVLREEFIDYVIAGLQEELRQRHQEFESGLKALRDEKQQIEMELKRLVEIIAVGNGSTTVMAAITEREARLREIANQVIEPGPGSLQEKLDELRTFAVSRLTRLKELLTKPTTIHEARAVLAEQIGKFTLQRAEENGAFSFKADGSIDFFGDEAFTRVGGAGGPDRTTRVYHFGLSLAA